MKREHMTNEAVCQRCFHDYARINFELECPVCQQKFLDSVIGTEDLGKDEDDE